MIDFKYYFYTYETERNKFGSSNCGSGVFQCPQYMSPDDVYIQIQKEKEKKLDKKLYITNLQKID